MTPEQRRRSVMAHEGQVLAAVCRFHDGELSGDVARCVADGAMNALIRIEGGPEAAKFAFALADRVVGEQLVPTLTPVVLPPPPPRPRPAAYTIAKTFLLGLACGAIIGMFGRLG